MEVDEVLAAVPMVVEVATEPEVELVVVEAADMVAAEGFKNLP